MSDIDHGREPGAGPDGGEESLSTASIAGAEPKGAPPQPRSFDPAARDGSGEDQARARQTPLLAEREVDDLRRNWDAIQAGFVDEPRRAVEDADQLVALTMKRLAEMFAGERSNLEGQWDRGDQVSTEDLRVALRRYRSFFDRLLSV